MTTRRLRIRTLTQDDRSAFDCAARVQSNAIKEQLQRSQDNSTTTASPNLRDAAAGRKHETCPFNVVYHRGRSP